MYLRSTWQCQQHQGKLSSAGHARIPSRNSPGLSPAEDDAVALAQPFAPWKSGFREVAPRSNSQQAAQIGRDLVGRSVEGRPIPGEEGILPLGYAEVCSTRFVQLASPNRKPIFFSGSLLIDQEPTQLWHERHAS